MLEATTGFEPATFPRSLTISGRTLVDPKGIEPIFAACKAAVLPLNERPTCKLLMSARRRPLGQQRRAPRCIYVVCVSLVALD